MPTNLIDPAQSMLLQLLAESSGKTLWFADENISTDTIAPQHSSIDVYTNRYDIFTQLDALGWRCTFNDFDTQAHKPHSIDTIFIRLPKEKALAHFLINQSALLLKQNGKLYLIGHKSEGIRGYNKRAQLCLGGAMQECKHPNDLWTGCIFRNTHMQIQRLDDQNYTELREINSACGFSFVSKPGLYGWNKIDQGSALLIQQVDWYSLQRENTNTQVLDLGCGYGYLSLCAALPNIQLTCVDNNAAAITACEANLQRVNLSVMPKVLASDAGSNLNDLFDVILCNPPFHSGFSTSSNLTRKFIQAAARLLAPDGQAFFVVNQHVALENVAKDFFATIIPQANNGHFKIVTLSQPQKKG